MNFVAGGRVPGGNGAGGTTGQPALVYFPPGQYLVSGTIQLYVDTQIIGDASDIPTIKAASTFSHTYVMSGLDPGEGSTTEFQIGIRNIEIDTTAVNVNQSEHRAHGWGRFILMFHRCLLPELGCFSGHQSCQ